MHLNIIRRLGALMAVVLLLSACSVMDRISPGRNKVDYKKSRAVDTLEVPPDLSSNSINDAPESLNAAASASASASLETGGRSSLDGSVLPRQSGISVERDGDQQWLLVQGSVEQVWPRVKEFWLQEGFLLQVENPQLGLLETNWSENRADIPQGFIRKSIGKVLDAVYSAATRDKYRVRLERGSDGNTTEVYLTHRGVEEVVSGGAVDNSTIWQARPNDPELEAEMLKRMMVYLGVEERRASAELARQSDQRPRAELVADGSGSVLTVREDFSRAWRRTGVALDRVGFTVNDRDRSAGTYYVSYNDPLAEQNREGILSKLAFWSSDDRESGTEYRIELQADGANTRVLVRNSEGERDSSSTAKRILTLLQEQLR